VEGVVDEAVVGEEVRIGAGMRGDEAEVWVWRRRRAENEPVGFGRE